MQHLKYVQTKPGLEPKYSSTEAAAFDIFMPSDCCRAEIEPNDSVCINTGLKFDIPKGYCLLAVNKSSLGKRGLIVGAQLIDSDFTGAISCNLHNVSNSLQILYPNDKIMQVIVQQHETPKLCKVLTIDKVTERGSKGFGSTN